MPFCLSFAPVLCTYALPWAETPLTLPDTAVASRPYSSLTQSYIISLTYAASLPACRRPYQPHNPLPCPLPSTSPLACSFAMICFQLFEGVPPFWNMDPIEAARGAALKNLRPQWGPTNRHDQVRAGAQGEGVPGYARNVAKRSVTLSCSTERPL